MGIKTCPKCKQSFTCCNEESGCWCEGLSLSKESLVFLKENYDNCLCKNCLKEFEGDQKSPCVIEEK